jgi:protoporphyrinogen oxidase
MSAPKLPDPIVVIGAGPAGLTAALCLLRAQPGIDVVVLEASDTFGGLSRTVRHGKKRMDIGGHRFYSKDPRVNAWWESILPSTAPAGETPKMMRRERKSRILHIGKLFDYPMGLSINTFRNLGWRRTLRIGLSYLKAHWAPRPERSLADFFSNRFGQELYKTFFKSYTEKVWGKPCEEISPEWGAQRVKGLNLLETLKSALRGKSKETSLIKTFLYPQLGPGQMWETCAEEIVARGGTILKNAEVTSLNLDSQTNVVAVGYKQGGEEQTIACSQVISSMAIKDLVAAMKGPVPENVKAIASGLEYRDFITIGLEVPTLRLPEPKPSDQTKAKDNWIYIQEPHVLLGRLQIFNNWSPYLTDQPSKVWLGLEYFCQEGDQLWKKTDEELKVFAASELEKLGLITKPDAADAPKTGLVTRARKAYPAYFGTHDRLPELRAWTDKIENLSLIGRNGMHRYNNQDHAMASAMVAAEKILNGDTDKAAIWDVNTEKSYGEESKC